MMVPYRGKVHGAESFKRGFDLVGEGHDFLEEVQHELESEG